MEPNRFFRVFYRGIPVTCYIAPNKEIFYNATKLCKDLANPYIDKTTLWGTLKTEERLFADFIEQDGGVRTELLKFIEFMKFKCPCTLEDLTVRGIFKKFFYGVTYPGYYVPAPIIDMILIQYLDVTPHVKSLVLIDMHVKKSSLITLPEDTNAVCALLGDKVEKVEHYDEEDLKNMP